MNEINMKKYTKDEVIELGKKLDCMGCPSEVGPSNYCPFLKEDLNCDAELFDLEVIYNLREGEVENQHSYDLIA